MHSFKLLIMFVVSVFTANLFAGGCIEKEITHQEELLAMNMAAEIRQRIIEIDKSTGGDNEVFLIARLGQSMDGFETLNNEHLNAGSLEDIFNKVDQHFYVYPGKSPKDKIRQKRKLKYSHVGFIFKHSNYKANEGIKVNDWVYVSHLLAHCNKESKSYGDSEIVFEKFPRFFYDSKILPKDEDDKKNQVLLMVPKLDIQHKLKFLLSSSGGKVALDGLHQPKYNVVSSFRYLKPTNTVKNTRLNKKQAKKVAKRIKPTRLLPKQAEQLEFQNSTQWPLEMVAASLFDYGIVANRSEAHQVLNHKNDIDYYCYGDDKSTQEQEYCNIRSKANTAYIPSLLIPTSIKNYQACGLANGLLGTGLLWDFSNLINCSVQSYRSKKIYQLATVDSLAKWMSKNSFLRDEEIGLKAYRDFSRGVYEVEADMSRLRLAKKFGNEIDKVSNTQDSAENKKMIKDYARKHRLTRQEAKKKLKKLGKLK